MRYWTTSSLPAPEAHSKAVAPLWSRSLGFHASPVCLARRLRSASKSPSFAARIPTGICLSRGWTFFTSLRKRQRHTNHQDFGFPPEQKALHNKRKGIATPTLLVDRPCRPHHPHRHRCQTDSQAEGGHSFHRLFCQRLAGLPKLDSTLLLRPRDHFRAPS